MAHPVVHKASMGFVVEDGWWLPGIYETAEAAERAASFEDAVLSALNKRICHIDAENRQITMADLDQADVTVAETKKDPAAP